MLKKRGYLLIKRHPPLLLNDSSFLFCKNDTRIYAKLGFANLNLKGSLGDQA